jgi:hypothetical protein
VEYDKDKVDDMMLALLHLTTFEDGLNLRAWKGMDWEVCDRLHERATSEIPGAKRSPWC